MSPRMAIHLLPGDRIVVEAGGMEPFEATVKMPLGWGLVNSSMDLAMRRDDDTEFTYGIRYDQIVTLIDAANGNA